MSWQAAAVSTRTGEIDHLRLARQILHKESECLRRVAERLDDRFCQAVEQLYHCGGSVIVTGIGKAGFIGQKITATLASTGTPSHWLHPAEAVHGDLGRVSPRDTVLVLSQSGETEEILRLLPSLVQLGVPIIAITERAESSLGRAARVVLELGAIEEACSLGLAPSASTTAMLAVGDALALVTSRMRGFRREDFARFHPGGSLGRKLSKVDDYLRGLDRCRVAPDSGTVRDVFVSLSMPGRRTGAIMLVDGKGRLSGIFTDSDLARLFEHRRDKDLDGPVAAVMTAHPLSVDAGSMMVDAVALMAARKISELPVVDPDGKPVGLLDITDVLAIFPECDPNFRRPAAPQCRIYQEPRESQLAEETP